MSEDEDVSHMALWAITACKLLISVDPRKYSAQAVALVTNKEVIAIDQDPLKLQVQWRLVASLLRSPLTQSATSQWRLVTRCSTHTTTTLLN